MLCRGIAYHWVPLLISIGLGSSFAYSESADLRQIASHLKNTYVGKEIILENFYCGLQLQYSSSSPLHKASPSTEIQSWTTCGIVKLKKITGRLDRLALEGQRIVYHYDDRSKKMVPY